MSLPRIFLQTLCFSLFCIRSAGAQIVNMQSTLMEEPEEGLSAEFSATADWSTGNETFLFLGATGLVRYQQENNMWLAVANGKSKRSLGKTIARKSFAHLRYRRKFTQEIGLELFLQHAFDERRRLQTRALLGLGPHLRILQQKKATLELGVAYMFEYELLNEAKEEIDAGAIQRNHRLSTYGVLQLNVAKNIDFLETFYFQSRFDAPNDLRLSSDTSFHLKVNESIKLVTSYSLTWDRTPPIGIKKLDSSFIQRIAISF